MVTGVWSKRIAEANERNDQETYEFVERHRAIVTAIKAGDAKAAPDAMVAVILAGRKIELNI